MIKTLFTDIGGVFLTNGWDTASRKLAVSHFGLDLETFNYKHRLIFDTFEVGKATIDDYLDMTVFYTERPFSREEFKQFMFEQSKPLTLSLEWFKEIKKTTHLKIVATSNEPREIMEYRINRFDLKSFIDIFVCSCFVGMRKPDKEFFKLALDLSFSKPEEVVYIDDRKELTDVGKSLGMHVICHDDLEKTKMLLDKVLQS